MDQNFKDRGFTDIIDVSLDNELINLQNLIYQKTKHLLVTHDENLSINEKINLKLKNDGWNLYIVI